MIVLSFYDFTLITLNVILILFQVPSITDDLVENFASFTEQIPLFEFIGKQKLIDSSIPYDIHNDSDVQLVCKYLNALNVEKDHPGKGIDKKFYGQCSSDVFLKTRYIEKKHPYNCFTN